MPTSWRMPSSVGAEVRARDAKLGARDGAGGGVGKPDAATRRPTGSRSLRIGELVGAGVDELVGAVVGELVGAGVGNVVGAEVAEDSIKSCASV
eukprot:4744808-Pyramimonas_sp.AAC.1